ncbi:Hypothetical protein GbCGDNIH7_7041 [Granulibacter bethesdensis]|nr:Hypothetical protein GbCGDNIH7_7041 [Granulibacter bethesdensis]
MSFRGQWKTARLVPLCQTTAREPSGTSWVSCFAALRQETRLPAPFMPDPRFDKGFILTHKKKL